MGTAQILFDVALAPVDIILGQNKVDGQCGNLTRMSSSQRHTTTHVYTPMAIYYNTTRAPSIGVREVSKFEDGYKPITIPWRRGGAHACNFQRVNGFVLS